MSKQLSHSEQIKMRRLRDAELRTPSDWRGDRTLGSRLDMDQGAFAYYNQPVFGEYNDGRTYFGYCRTCNMCSVMDDDSGNNALKARLCDKDTNRCVRQTGDCDNRDVAFNGEVCRKNSDCDWFALPRFLCRHNNGYVTSNDNPDMCVAFDRQHPCETPATAGKDICKCPKVLLGSDGKNASAAPCTLTSRLGLRETFYPPA